MGRAEKMIMHIDLGSIIELDCQTSFWIDQNECVLGRNDSFLVANSLSNQAANIFVNLCLCEICRPSTIINKVIEAQKERCCCQVIIIDHKLRHKGWCVTNCLTVLSTLPEKL